MKSPKKVRFSRNVSARPILKMSSEMQTVEKSRVYYSRDDIQRIHDECRELCRGTIRRVQSLHAINPALSLEQHFIKLIESDGRLRGFEVRLSSIRKESRSMINKAVVDLYLELKHMPTLCPRQKEIVLAQTYARLSCSSQMQAILTGGMDRLQSCQQDHAVVSEASASSSSNSSLPHIVSVENKMSALTDAVGRFK